MNPLFNSSRWGKSTACACLDCDTTYGSVLTNCPCSHTTGGGSSLPQVSSTISDQDSSHVHCYSLVFCCPAAQTPWLAGCPHSAQRGWLIICQPLWGMRPTTGPVFLKPAMKIREWGWSGHSAGKEEGEQRGKEGQRKQGRASRFPDFHCERECSSDSVLQQSQSLGTDTMALLAHYHCQPQCINAGTRAENVFRSIYFFTSACTWCSPDAKNTL